MLSKFGQDILKLIFNLKEILETLTLLSGETHVSLTL